MAKSSGPARKLNLPKVKPCEFCENGFIKGQFYEMECNACDASGIVDCETGDPVPRELLIPAMRKTITRQKVEIRYLKEQNRRLSPESNSSETHYPEDMPRAGSGQYRMD